MRALPTAALLTLASLAALAPPVAAQLPDQPCADGELPEVTAFHFIVGDANVSALPVDMEGGSEVTVHFTLEGCGQRVMAFAAYEAEAGFRLEDQTLHNSSVDVFAAGEGSLTIHLPFCLFQVDFVYGDVIVHFDTEDGTTYHDQGRFIAGVQGGTTGCSTSTTTTSPTSPPATGTTTATATTTGSSVPPSPDPHPCPTGLEASANDGGSITLSFTPAPGANATKVYRATGTGDLELLATIPPGVMGYTDTTATAGTAYRFMVTATFAAGFESQGCAVVEVSSIPEFPTALAMGVAVACGLLAYTLVRRRRA